MFLTYHLLTKEEIEVLINHHTIARTRLIERPPHEISKDRLDEQISEIEERLNTLNEINSSWIDESEEKYLLINNPVGTRLYACLSGEFIRSLLELEGEDLSRFDGSRAFGLSMYLQLKEVLDRLQIKYQKSRKYESAFSRLPIEKRTKLNELVKMRMKTWSRD